MNANAFRYLYEYHFTENRRIWDSGVLLLSAAQFTQDAGYSHGSVHDQVVHLMNVDEVWFGELCGAAFIEPFDPASAADRERIRAHWDRVEQMMRAYLAGLTDEMLFTRPITEEEDQDLIVWQVLLHVVNHGTDHRAQLLRVLHDLGVKTTSQDFIFYVYDHP